MDEKALVDAQSSLFASNGGQHLKVFEDRTEVSTWSVMGDSVQSVRHGQIAGLRVDNAFVFFADLILETRGGAMLRVQGLPKKKAYQAADLIKDRM